MVNYRDIYLDNGITIVYDKCLVFDHLKAARSDYLPE
jgi:hypothetical protein